MTAGLKTFEKIRALHDSTTNAGEKASAAARMKTLARKAGLTVDEAVSKLDAPPPAPKPSSFFEDLFNRPEFCAQRAEQDRRKADRRAAALKEYGSEDAVWQPCEWEQALEAACRPVVVRKPIINGESDTLQGWDGGYFERMPAEVRAAVASAYPLPVTVREAWAELQFWDKLYDDRNAFGDHDHRVWVRARTAYVEHLLDTLPAKSINDLLGRVDWMGYLNDRGYSRDVHEDAALLATLRADIERMGQRIREQDEPRHDGGSRDGSDLSHAKDHAAQHTPSRPPEPASPSASSSVQSGQAEGCSPHEHPLRRTNADKRADVLALLIVGIPHNTPLSDREIARRAGVSPTTVGTIRRSLA